PAAVQHDPCNAGARRLSSFVAQSPLLRRHHDDRARAMLRALLDFRAQLLDLASHAEAAKREPELEAISLGGRRRVALEELLIVIRRFRQKQRDSGAAHDRNRISSWASCFAGRRPSPGLKERKAPLFS